MKVTELRRSDTSSCRAASAGPAYAERWHGSSCHVAEDVPPECGLPSPEATESPMDTIRWSCGVTSCSIVDTVPMSSSTSSRTVTASSSSTSIAGLHGVAAGSSTVPSTVHVYLAIVRPGLAFDPHPSSVTVKTWLANTRNWSRVSLPEPFAGSGSVLPLLSRYRSGTDQSKRARGRPCGGVANAMSTWLWVIGLAPAFDDTGMGDEKPAPLSELADTQVVPVPSVTATATDPVVASIVADWPAAITGIGAPNRPKPVADVTRTIGGAEAGSTGWSTSSTWAVPSAVAATGARNAGSASVCIGLRNWPCAVTTPSDGVVLGATGGAWNASTIVSSAASSETSWAG